MWKWSVEPGDVAARCVWTTSGSVASLHSVMQSNGAALGPLWLGLSQVSNI